MLKQSDCGFTKTFNGGFTPIPDVHFNVSYKSREFLLGPMGYAPVTIGGITIPRQEMAFVDSAFWDNSINGILGLAYPSDTSVFKGPASNATADSMDPSRGSHVGCNSLMFNMIQAKAISPLFSVALARENDTDDAPGGQIAFGGLPPVNTQGPFAKTPIIKVSTCANSFAALLGKTAYRGARRMSTTTRKRHGPLKTSHTTPSGRTQSPSPERIRRWARFGFLSDSQRLWIPVLR